MAETTPAPSALSLGMSDFAAIRREGAIYVDKTDMIFELTRLSRSYFLSRPRRFGKSLLVSTLENFFLGRKELFRGLKIFDMEEESSVRPWTKFPVFKFDFAGGNLEAGGRAECAPRYGSLTRTRPHTAFRQAKGASSLPRGWLGC